MSSKKADRNLKFKRGPKPRAAFLVDSVLTRGGIVDIRRIYVGPKNVDPDDMINLLTANLATVMLFAFPEAELREDACVLLLKQLEERLSGDLEDELRGLPASETEDENGDENEQ